jgi:dual specificity MAP kinase phosphatase
MAVDLFIYGSAIGKTKTFLQASVTHLTASTSDSLVSKSCLNIDDSDVCNTRSTRQQKVESLLPVSHLGLSLQELDLLSSAQIDEVDSSQTRGLSEVNEVLYTQLASKCGQNETIATSQSVFEYSITTSSDEATSLDESVISSKELVELINSEMPLLLLDCRTFLAFNGNRINGALNVSCSDRITRKRILDGKINIGDIVSGQEGKELYRKLESEAEIVVYDESTVELCSLPETNSLHIITKSLLKHGKQSRFLKGGLQEFQKRYSIMCTQPDSSLGVPLLFSPTSPEVNCDIDTAVASEILPFLFIGNQRDAANRERLTELGVTHILNVTAHLPLHFENDGITYLRLPASDSGSQNLKQYFSEAISFIENARTANGKVLVHCQAGVSRSPSIVAAYLISRSHKTLSDAFTFIKDRRSIVAPNINFMGQLLEFEQHSGQRSGLCPPSEPLHLLRV